MHVTKHERGADVHAPCPHALPMQVCEWLTHLALCVNLGDSATSPPSNQRLRTCSTCVRRTQTCNEKVLSRKVDAEEGIMVRHPIERDTQGSFRSCGRCAQQSPQLLLPGRVAHLQGERKQAGKVLAHPHKVLTSIMNETLPAGSACTVLQPACSDMPGRSRQW